MTLLCYRCPLEEECKWARKRFDTLNSEYVYDRETRRKNCPLLKLLKEERD